MRLTFIAARLALIAMLAAGTSLAQDQPLRRAGSDVPPAPPSELFDRLFVRAATSGVFPDFKIFVDAVPREAPARNPGRLSRPAAALESGVGEVRATIFHAAAARGHARAATGPPDRRSHRGSLADPDAHDAGRSRLFVGAAVARALCRARRAFHRDLLLGFLFHDAGPRARASRRSATAWSRISRT